MSLENIEKNLRQKITTAPHLKGKVKFNFGDQGVIFIDTTQTPPLISHEDAEADVELIVNLDTFQGILNGTQNPNVAFMMGKLKIKGSMGLAMKLNEILED